jgi:hypothetical protein
MNTAQGNGDGDIETRACANHGRGRSDSSHRAYATGQLSSVGALLDVGFLLEFWGF